MAKDFLYPLRRLHGFLHDATEAHRKKAAFLREVYRPLRQEAKEDPALVYLVLTPSHGNLGDHAIALSESSLLDSLGIRYREITGRQLFPFARFHRLSFMNRHTILINGGGNLGTIWFSTELLHRRLVRANPDSRIAILPNTIHYEQSAWGRKEEQRSSRLYNRHPALLFCAREKTSYETMRRLYRHVLLCPDVVLFLNESEKQETRRGCLLCLRSDIEQTRTDGDTKIIRTEAEALFGRDVLLTDMFVGDTVLPEDRRKTVEAKLQEFRSAELVITDRLHGMIFAVITGTPCIVIDSKSPKVRGCYEWVRDLPYLRFADRPEQIGELFRQIPDQRFLYDPERFAEYREKLLLALRELCDCPPAP